MLLRNGVLKFALFGELLSWPRKIRAGIGAFLGNFPAPEGKDENIREWVTRVLGEKFPFAALICLCLVRKLLITTTYS